MTHEEKNINSDTEFKAPEWINTDLIQKALRNNADTNLEVENIAVRVATVTGDNYASTIYRVKAELSDGNAISLLVKGPPPGQAMNDATQEWGAFKREEQMLTKVIPEMQTLLETAAPGRFEPLAARCLLYGTQPVEFLVLEDLAPAGFKMADRKRGLGLRHSLLALQALARFHAASHALLRQKPELNEQMPNPYISSIDTKDPFMAYVDSGLQMAADACRSWPGYEEYAELLEKYKLCTVGSPAIDILFFCSSSVTDDVSAHHQDLLLREYHRTLEETLKLLNLEAPSFETLMEDLDAHGPMAVIGAISIIPICRAQSPVDAEDLVGDTSSLSHLYEDPAVKRWIQRILPQYKQKGWLLN